MKQVNPNDAVVYSAKAENVAGVAKCSANLVVDCKLSPECLYSECIVIGERLIN